MLHLTRRATFALALLALPATAQADEALVAVAANFAGAAEAISAEFTRETGHTLTLTTGATGKLYAQIAEGAPFDVMLSADAKTPAKIEKETLGVAGSSFTYAIGKLALWSPDAGRIGADPKAALTDPATLFIAIANPELAPYGLAAQETLQSLGLWDAVQPKIVLGENIGQAQSLAQSGAAQLAFVAASAVRVPGAEMMGSAWEVPQELFTPIRQDTILLNHGAENAAALAFMQYLQGAKAREITQSFGYGIE
ncbi:molybdate ABC transporter substrate-binding protein [Rhodobacter ferrooxidans]|uniref:Molybdenum ABC transporter, periplasmic molybdate-binding protein n=1 Tax=Rhodobacter ferrooxidans TaxID=371731 RepID=C8S184_9RHOB|nr:molybdate ABC transporter substrate-binding protein [Rhodobacter sp. SW2]EEW25282.1 molybdenum ABC transporter, periplasmic molybdate-binding protein [Rhodobacter sp. SW2]